MGSRLVAKKIGKDGSDAIRIADGSQRAIAADLAGGGRITLTARSAAPTNESDTLKSCQTLIQHLRAGGAEWLEPTAAVGPERGVDCISRSPSGAVISIQVTRPAFREYWLALGVRNEAEVELTVEEASRMILDSVRAKAKRIGPRDRREITIAINVADVPALTLDQVVAHVRTVYGVELANFGFSSVWLVGEIDSLAFQLDSRDPR